MKEIKLFQFLEKIFHHGNSLPMLTLSYFENSVTGFGFDMAVICKHPNSSKYCNLFINYHEHQKEEICQSIFFLNKPAQFHKHESVTNSGIACKV